MKFYTLQLYRFIAAGLVMFHHLNITCSGNNGVYIFFLISGFVIYLKLFSPDPPTPFQFFRNRITKIFFLYWVSLFFLWFIHPFPLDYSAVKTILLFPDHISQIKVSWSLSYELYFYFLTASIAYLLPVNYSKMVLLFFLIISTFTTILYIVGYIQIKDSPLNFCLGKNTWHFFLGLLSGYLSAIPLKSFKISPALPAFVLGIILISTAFMLPSDNLLPVLAIGMLATLLVWSSTVYERRNPLTVKWALFFGVLGDASYAMYLFAPIVGILIPGRNPFEKTMIVLLTIMLSIFANRYIEGPGLAFWRKMFTGVDTRTVYH